MGSGRLKPGQYQDRRRRVDQFLAAMGLSGRAASANFKDGMKKWQRLLDRRSLLAPHLPVIAPIRSSLAIMF